MGAACPVLLLGEGGELGDVVSALRSLDVAFELREAADGPVALPRDLLVATARRGIALPPPPRGPLEGRGPARVALVDSDSPGLRAGLRDAGFDLLIRPPVHPTALRLLLLRLLYRGPERRRETRVSVGTSARYRAGLLWRRAVLAELSTGGCRLLVPRTLSPGARIAVEIPGPEGATLRLAARVVRSNSVSPTDPTCTVAVAFEKVTAAARERLARIVAAHERGPASMPGGWDLQETLAPPAEVAAEPTEIDPAAPELAETASEPQSEGTPGERRSSARPAYTMRVVTLGEEAARVVMGRDLSTGGIRIEPHGAIERGQRLALALHGGGLAVPLVVRGVVIRDDGDAGLVIRFDTLSPAQTDALGKIVAGLGCIETIGPHAETTPALVTRVL